MNSSDVIIEDPLNYNGTNITDSYAIGATIASPITMAMAGVVGNLLALVVLHRTKTEIRRMMFYTLVAALSCTDLAGILLTTPVTVAAYINRREMPGGIGLCKFNAFIMVCFGLATPLIVCAMAVERFLAIKCTYFYSKHCTPHNARRTVVILWAFVFFFGALPLFGFGEFSLQFPNTWCFINFHTRDIVISIYGYMYAGLNLGIVVLMTCCNVFVIITLMQARYIKRHQGRKGSLLQDDKRQLHAQMKKTKQNDVEMQMIWLMSTITTVFGVCWAPLMIHIIMTLATQKSNPVLGLLAIRLASLNQTMDPWLYILLRKAFLKKVLKMMKNIFCSRSTPPPEVPDHKCNRYVHVRHQLFHRNYYVGNTDPDNRQSNSGNDTTSGLKGNCQHSGNDKVSGLKDKICLSGGQQLPDVMRTTSSGHSDALPDVTLSNGPSRFLPERNSSKEVPEQPEVQNGIYVDLFQLLPNESDSKKNDRHAVSKNLGSDGFYLRAYSSGSFNFATNDILSGRHPHSDVTPVRHSKRGDATVRPKSST